MAKIGLVRILHVYYKHTNLEQAQTFLEDFGLSVVASKEGRVFFRGTGPDPFVYCAEQGDENEFGGAAFLVASLTDLEAASQLPGALGIRDLDAPGGGKIVTVPDPFGNRIFHLVYGQQAVQSNHVPSEAERPFNFPEHKHRGAGEFQRYQKAPCPVYKLGHFGVCVPNFEAMFAFVTSNFNLAPSDLVHDETGRNVATFLHLDRGNELVDHHSFFFYEGPKYHVHHSSFEVEDMDSQQLGHDWLASKGYTNCWGVGRHVLGSQIFDYWFDPASNILEHYTDGDMVDASTVVAKSKLGKEGLYVWGPDVPETFLT